MSKINTIQTNFTAGELSPSMYGRFDYARYNNGAKTVKNCLPIIQGGLLKRAGSMAIGDNFSVGYGNYRLVPFVLDSNTSYVLMFDGAGVYFYKNKAVLLSGGSPYYLSGFSINPTALENFKYIQIADTLIIVTGIYNVKYIKRISDTNWVTKDFDFVVPPLIEGEFKTSGFCDETLAYSANQITLGSAVFGGWLASDVGRQVRFDDGSLVTITNIVSTTVADVSNIITPITTTYPVKTWRLLDSPQASLSIPFATSKSTTCTAAAATFRALDVGRYIVTPDAVYQITAYTSSTVVSVRIVETKISTTDAPAAGAWTLESFVFSGDYGYPKAVTFFEGRLVFGGLTNLPSTIWASKSGEQKNFKLGTTDNDGFSFDLSSGRNEQLVSLVSDKTLLAFTYDSVISLNGGNGEPLTPTNVQKRVQSSRGCNNLAPIFADNSLVFVQRNDKKIVNIKYDASSYGYFDTEITIICNHLLDNNTVIVDMAFSQEPYSVIYFVLSDGSMITCTYYQQEQIIAFARHETNGEYKNVCVIPHDGKDEVWAVAMRYSDPYIELLDFEYVMDFQIDFDYTGTPTSAIADARNAYKTLDVIADGINLGQLTASAGGLITLPNSYEYISTGHAFYPEITLLPVQFANPNAILGYNQNINRIALQFLETQSAIVNDSPVEFLEFGTTVLDEPLPMFTGVKVIDSYTIEVDGKDITITQNSIGSFCLLSAVRVIDVNN